MWTKKLADDIVVDIGLMVTGDVMYTTHGSRGDYARLLSADGQSAWSVSTPFHTPGKNRLYMSVNRETGYVAVIAGCMMYVYRRDQGKLHLHTSLELEGKPYEVICWISSHQVIMSQRINLVKYSLTDRQIQWKKPIDCVSSICADKKGNIYVALLMQKSIQVYNINGDNLHTVPRDPNTSEMYRPEAICVDSADNLYVLYHQKGSCYTKAVVSVYNTDGSYIRRLITIDLFFVVNCQMTTHDNTLIISCNDEIRKYHLTPSS